MMPQLLQHFRHKRRGDAILLGDLVGAASMLLTMQRQVLDCNQPVVGLLGKLEHRLRDFLGAPEYATESVAHEVYAQRRPKVNPKEFPTDNTTPVFLAAYNKTKIVLHAIRIQLTVSHCGE